jgi:hypothetical protein
MTTVKFLAAAVFANTIASGVILVDVTPLDPSGSGVAQTIVALVSLVFTACGGALLVLGGRNGTPTPPA